MGEASVILGVKIIRKGDSILLSQEKYNEKLLKKFGYYDFKSVSTPYDANSKFGKSSDKTPREKNDFRNIEGNGT